MYKHMTILQYNRRWYLESYAHRRWAQQIWVDWKNTDRQEAEVEVEAEV